MFFCGCAKHTKKDSRIKLSSGPSVTLNESPEFFINNLSPINQGISNWRELEKSIDKSLAYVSTKPENGYAIKRKKLSITWGILKNSLEKLKRLLPELDKNPKILLEQFKWVKIDEGIDYSGYYEPVVKASRTKKPGYEQAIYKLPPDLNRIKAKRRGKYYDRRTIEEKQILAGRNLELAWAADPVDVFYLEIQGSGKLLFDDGTSTYVNYAGQNGYKYKSSGKIMREKGLLQRGDIFEQREWFKNNPSRVKEILYDNPSYVFFKFGNGGSTGAMGAIVDSWRSLASDRKFIPLGSIVAFGVDIPYEQGGTIPLRGIGFSQDVGGAIKKNRIDIFCGEDERACYVASHLDAKGPAWVLLAR